MGNRGMGNRGMGMGNGKWGVRNGEWAGEWAGESIKWGIFKSGNL